ncbi:hypothetical protein ACU4GD_04105 [Cupriavidus basilensis]
MGLPECRQRRARPGRAAATAARSRRLRGGSQVEVEAIDAGVELRHLRGRHPRLGIGLARDKARLLKRVLR